MLKCEWTIPPSHIVRLEFRMCVCIWQIQLRHFWSIIIYTHIFIKQRYIIYILFPLFFSRCFVFIHTSHTQCCISYFHHRLSKPNAHIILYLIYFIWPRFLLLVLLILLMPLMSIFVVFSFGFARSDLDQAKWAEKIDLWLQKKQQRHTNTATTGAASASRQH